MSGCTQQQTPLPAATYSQRTLIITSSLFSCLLVIATACNHAWRVNSALTWAHMLFLYATPIYSIYTCTYISRKCHVHTCSHTPPRLVSIVIRWWPKWQGGPWPWKEICIQNYQWSVCSAMIGRRLWGQHYLHVKAWGCMIAPGPILSVVEWVGIPLLEGTEGHYNSIQWWEAVISKAQA